MNVNLIWELTREIGLGWIRNLKKNLKDEDLDVYDLINRPTRKFEPSIMVVGAYPIMVSVKSFSLKEP